MSNEEKELLLQVEEAKKELDAALRKYSPGVRICLSLQNKLDELELKRLRQSISDREAWIRRYNERNLVNVKIN